MDNGKQKHTCEELEEVVRTLRGEHGCPWDKAQTLWSMRPCLIEEAYEYLAAVRIYEKTGNAENLQEELGDLLFYVVMSSRIAGEQGLFSLSDVVEDICTKMIRRHPHVFGGQADKQACEEQKSWDEIKKQEKQGKSWIESPLREIPMEHPALIRGPKVFKKADKLYEACPDEETTLIQMEQEIQTLLAQVREKEGAAEEAGSKEFEENRKRVVGNLLMELCNLSRLWKLTPEQILQDRIEDFIEEKEKL